MLCTCNAKAVPWRLPKLPSTCCSLARAKVGFSRQCCMLRFLWTFIMHCTASTTPANESVNHQFCNNQIQKAECDQFNKCPSNIFKVFKLDNLLAHFVRHNQQLQLVTPHTKYPQTLTPEQIFRVFKTSFIFNVHSLSHLRCSTLESLKL